MTNKEFIVASIYNIIIICIFATIASIFNQWWIILLSILFCVFPKVVHRYYRICDKCGRKSEHADTSEEALNKAIQAGWEHHCEYDTDYCPICKDSIK